MLKTFLELIFAHALTDWCWQPDTMGLCKNPRLEQRMRNPHENNYHLMPFVKAQQVIPWYWWLGFHAVAQGAGVYFVTQSVPLALAEIVAHGLIDLGKCLGYYDIRADQALHVTSKLVWALLA